MARIIALSGDVGWEITAELVRAELNKANGGDVEFHVNSRGGFVFEGIEIFNVIREYKGHTEARIVGLAASMASYIVLAADKVTAYDNAVFMIHNALALSVGNHNDMRKTADVLESLSNIIAQAYVKKTGKTIEAVKALMDDETFLFGNEILTENFIDEILESPDDEGNDDKASAIIVARESINACMNKMRDSEAANSDLDRAVAYMDGMSALMADPAIKKPTVPAAVMGSVTVPNATITTPAGAGTTQEDIMTFAEFLTANPTERAAHDAALATARAEGGKAAKDEMKAVIAKVSPILGSADYPAAIKDYGVKAIVGEGALATFDALVVMEDQRIEAAKAAAAKGETGETGETAGGTDVGGEAEAESKFQEKFKRIASGV